MHITFNRVSMVHNGGREVLRNLSFDIPPRTQVALIGESGAGKSTIGALARRDSDPTSGHILVDGIPFSKYNLSSVLAHVGVILQHSEIISGTVRENLLLSVTKKRERSINDRHLWDVIDQVSPELRHRLNGTGLNTRVGKKGMRLSGGEQQRLCIMRALIKNPEFLIIDEATSSLDSETERSVQRGIDTALAKGISALIIAHRFSTLRNCNRFVVLKHLKNCVPEAPQIETISDSLTNLYQESAIFKRLADHQGFRP